MAAQRKSKEVDGLSLVRAVRHGREGGTAPPPSAASPPPKRPEKPPDSDAPNRPSRIGHTAMPTKNEIHCYECGYIFQSAGKPQTLRCHKCKNVLDQADYTIDAECTDSLRTTGNIKLAAGAVLKAGSLVGRDIVIAGRVEGGTVKAQRRIEIQASAVFDQDLLSGQDLTIGPGAVCRFRGKRLFRSVEIAGELDAHLAVSGSIAVKAGGHLKGRIEGAHLTVEEGGGLTAELEISPASSK